MKLAVQDLEYIQDLQWDGILPGSPNDLMIPRDIEHKYFAMKKCVREICSDSHIHSERSFQRKIKCLGEVVRLMATKFFGRQSPQDMAAKILIDIGVGRLDAVDLGYFSPLLLRYVHETYEKLKKNKFLKEERKSSAIRLLIKQHHSSPFAKRLKNQLSAKAMKVAIKTCARGWQTDSDRKVQLALTSFLAKIE